MHGIRTFLYRAAARSLFAPVLLATPILAQAQARELQTHPLGSAEGRLLGFYSAALSLTSLGTPFDAPPGSVALEFSFELSYVPHLSRQQRTAGFDKPEASNLSPVLPRPRLALALPATVTLEASWLPPIEVSDAKANLFSGALRRAFPLWQWKLTPRLSYMDGRVRGAITCSEALGEGTLDEQVYFVNVCHARESDDFFEPRHVALDFTIDAGPALLGANPYATLGIRREWTRFDIGVITDAGVRDADHPVLEMVATRPFGAFGMQWKTPGRTRVAAEVYYSPGSLVTLRTLAGWRIR